MPARAFRDVALHGWKVTPHGGSTWSGSIRPRWPVRAVPTVGRPPAAGLWQVHGQLPAASAHGPLAAV